MKFLSLLLVPFCLIWADQITLKNGDRITGSIVKKDKNNLTVKGAATGPITVPWDQIVSIQSDAKLNVVLRDKTLQSTLATSDGKVDLKEQNQSVAFTDIVTIRNGDGNRDPCHQFRQDHGVFQCGKGVGNRKWH